MEPARRIIKENPFRTVGVLQPEEGTWTVSKRFHHPHPLRAVRDRFRAENEFRVLRTLYDRGVRVPRPLEVLRRGRAWEVRMQWIPDALSLEDALPAARERGTLGDLAEELGLLLSSVFRAGVLHPDLHIGNVLVDPAGKPWLVDFQQAKLVSRWKEADAEDVLLTALVGLREITTVACRQRMFLAFAAGLPRELAGVQANAKALLSRVEREGRGERRRRLEVARARWLRASSLCRPAKHLGPERVLCRRDLAGEVLRRLAGPRPPADPSAEPAFYFLDGLPLDALRSAWSSTGRLLEHRLPALRPALFVDAERPWAGFEGPGPLAPCEGTPRAEFARRLGELLGALHERGLDPERLGPDELVQDERGALLLTPRARFTPYEPASDLHSPDQRLRAVVHTGVEARHPLEFVRGYVSAFRRNRREMELVARSLGAVLTPDRAVSTAGRAR